ncbi:RluA family pseudouridine synthase [Dysgonomonas sp. ZJ709]|uniref:RluA family pseudouridine synthase n=1 Tax=Dysgonomonas sp. ZJ709 TaxID=2709797 RepID=UPI0013E9CCB3|nr:RluA family pseudouridine synthase [Dysgonomonas sp. ZJ709]
MRTNSRDKALQEIKVSEPSQLLEFLVNKNVRKSRTAAKSLLAHKQIRINGKLITQFDFELKEGDMVAIMKYDQSRKEKRLKGLKIVYEDDYIVIVDKEVGLLSVSTEREKLRTAFGILNEYVKKQNKQSRVYVLHRLDREASGLMAFSKDQDIQSQFQKNWDKFVPVYTYTAVVEGEVNPKNGTIVSWLTENKNYQVFSTSFDNGGLKSVTHYKTVKVGGRYSLVNFNLETRRKNQLRAQMQQLGHPVVGDKKYGAANKPIKRIALHAQDMAIKHPVTGEMLEFKSPIPKTLLELLTDNTKIKHE